MNDIISKVQTNYAELLTHAFSSSVREVFTTASVSELRRFILQEIEAPALYMPGHRHPASLLDYKLYELLRHVYDFWRTNSEQLIKAIRSADSYRLLLPIQRFGYDLPRHLRALGIYFDTILMVDPLHFPSEGKLNEFLDIPPSHPAARQSRLILLEHVAYLTRVVSLMTLNGEYPLFVVIPEMLDFEKEKDLDESCAFLGTLFQDQDQEMDFTRYMDFIESSMSEEGLARRITNKALLDEMLHRFDNLGNETWVLNRETGRFSMKAQELRDYQLSEILLSLIWKVKGAVYSLRSTQYAAACLGVDPVVYNGYLFLHKWVSQRLARDYGSIRGPSPEEQAVSMALVSQEVDFLSAVSDLDLKRIRDDRITLQLRRDIRISRAALQHETQESISAAASEFGHNLVSLVQNFGEEVRIAKKRASRKMAVSGLIFIGTAALGLTALAIPQFTLLGFAATATGLLFGGKSVADMVRDHIEGRKTLTALDRSPVSLLYGAYRNYKGEVERGAS